ncbi:Uncharacterised protein [uncultured Comamonas sp.]|nr:Uncharacterised protein [uncultured Comamonas sp.]
MPIYRCNKCGFVCEDAQTPVHTPTPCGRCGTPSTVYGTVFFVEELIKRLATVTRDFKALQAQQAAAELGDNYPLFADLLDRVRYAYRKSYTNVNLELGKLSQKDGQTITKFCRNLYEHTFFARYHYQKPEKIARLTLQSAPAVRQFFEGGWLEWYALMQVLALNGQNAGNVSYARNVKVVFPNEDLHELDVVCLPAGQPPICIECKSGEFRRDIDKYLRLSKRLGLSKSRFIICSTDLTDEQAHGLSAMYDLSFVNLQTLKNHLQKVI